LGFTILKAGGGRGETIESLTGVGDQNRKYSPPRKRGRGTKDMWSGRGKAVRKSTYKLSSPMKKTWESEECCAIREVIISGSCGRNRGFNIREQEGHHRGENLQNETWWAEGKNLGGGGSKKNSLTKVGAPGTWGRNLAANGRKRKKITSKGRLLLLGSGKRVLTIHPQGERKLCPGNLEENAVQSCIH